MAAAAAVRANSAALRDIRTRDAATSLAFPEGPRLRAIPGVVIAPVLAGPHRQAGPHPACAPSMQPKALSGHTESVGPDFVL
jgi:hypothetical protein